MTIPTDSKISLSCQRCFEKFIVSRVSRDDTYRFVQGYKLGSF
jgi:hypothetical protein